MNIQPEDDRDTTQPILLQDPQEQHLPLVIISIIAFFLAIVVKIELGEDSAYYFAGYLAVFVFGLSLAIWGVFYLICRKRFPGKKLKTFGIVMMAVVFGSIINVYTNINSFSGMSGAPRNDAVKSLDSGVDGRSPGSPAKGDIAEFERFFRSNIKTIIALNSSYDQKLNAAGWNDILSLDRLKKDKKLAQSRTIIIKAKEALAEYQRDMEQIFLKMREDLISSFPEEELDEKTIQEIIKAFNEGLKNSEVRKNFEIEEKIISKVEESFDFLEEKQGKWSVRNDDLEFADPSDQDSYQRIIKGIVAYAEESEKMRQNARERVKEKIGKDVGN